MSHRSYANRGAGSVAGRKTTVALTAVLAASGLVNWSSPGAWADGLILTPMGGCPGLEAFSIRNATPLSSVAIVYGYGNGPKTIPGGLTCAGTVLDVSPPQFGWGITTTDSNGEGLFFARNLTNRMCDRLNLQAVDLVTCVTSNVVQP